MEFKDLEKVNKEIKGLDVKGKQYAEVNERILAFRKLYPNGSIETEILSNQDGVCVMKATIYDEEFKLLATGTAYEKENSTFINKTSYIENCETSAVGRALGMLGIGIDVSIASAEEVQNAIANQEKKANIEKLELMKQIKTLMVEKNIMPNEISETFGKSSSTMTVEELEQVKEWVEKHE